MTWGRWPYVAELKESTLKKNFLVCGSAVLMLAACGGSSGGSSNDITQNAYTFTDINAGVSSFAGLVDMATDGGISDRSDLPPGGGATYDGLISVTLADDTDDGVLGTMRLNVNYGSNSLSGSAGSFVNFDNEAVDGSLAITSGSISSMGQAAGFADVNGAVEFGAGTMTVSGTATHGFSGNEGQYNIGAFLGDEGTGQPAIGGAVDVDMSWAAERQ